MRRATAFATSCTVIHADDVQTEVDPCSGARGREDLSVVDVQDVRIDVDRGEALVRADRCTSSASWRAGRRAARHARARTLRSTRSAGEPRGGTRVATSTIISSVGGCTASAADAGTTMVSASFAADSGPQTIEDETHRRPYRSPVDGAQHELVGPRVEDLGTSSNPKTSHTTANSNGDAPSASNAATRWRFLRQISHWWGAASFSLQTRRQYGRNHSTMYISATSVCDRRDGG